MWAAAAAESSAPGNVPSLFEDEKKTRSGVTVLGVCLPLIPAPVSESVPNMIVPGSQSVPYQNAYHHNPGENDDNQIALVNQQLVHLGIEVIANEPSPRFRRQKRQKRAALPISSSSTAAPVFHESGRGECDQKCYQPQGNDKHVYEYKQQPCLQKCSQRYACDCETDAFRKRGGCTKPAPGCRQYYGIYTGDAVGACIFTSLATGLSFFYAGYLWGEKAIKRFCSPSMQRKLLRASPKEDGCVPLQGILKNSKTHKTPKNYSGPKLEIQCNDGEQSKLSYAGSVRYENNYAGSEAGSEGMGMNGMPMSSGANIANPIQSVFPGSVTSILNDQNSYVTPIERRMKTNMGVYEFERPEPLTTTMKAKASSTTAPLTTTMKAKASSTTAQGGVKVPQSVPSGTRISKLLKAYE